MSIPAKELCSLSIPQRVTDSNKLELPHGKHQIERNFYLLVRTDRGDSRSFIFCYMLNGRRREISLGSAYKLTLDEATVKAHDVRKLVNAGIDPIEFRAQVKLVRQPETKISVRTYYKRVFNELYEMSRSTCEKTKEELRRVMENYALPVIGDMPLSEVEPEDVARALKPIWKTLNPTACRVRLYLERLFAFAIRDRLHHPTNPAIWKNNMDTFLPPPFKVRDPVHYKAPIVEELANDIRIVISRDLSPCHAAYLFGALTATRRWEFSQARWEEIDFGRAIWNIPPERRKDRQNYPHRVPLSKQAILLLELIRAKSGPIFSNARGRPVAAASVAVALSRFSAADYCLHGMRSTFRDWAAENQVDFTTAEKCLMHNCYNKTVNAYLRTDLLEARRPVMQAWADEILPFEDLLAAYGVENYDY